jgi:hypothetical protein
MTVEDVTDREDVAHAAVPSRDRERECVCACVRACVRALIKSPINSITNPMLLSGHLTHDNILLGYGSRLHLSSFTKLVSLLKCICAFIWVTETVTLFSSWKLCFRQPGISDADIDGNLSTYEYIMKRILHRNVCDALHVCWFIKHCFKNVGSCPPYCKMCIFVADQSRLTGVARVLVKICKQEMSEIENCPDCYLNAHTRKDSWFIEVCVSTKCNNLC